jgi:thiol-disulfide isomerase/thioredoxin
MQNLKNKMLIEGLKLTAEEIEMFDFIQFYFVENFNAEATTNFSKLYMQAWNKFRTDHAEEIQEYMNNYYAENLKKNLKNIFEIESGLAVELTAVNNYYLPTLNKAEVPKTEAFNQIKKTVKNPALKEFVISDYYKKKAEYDLLNNGGKTVLNTEGDKIFQNIIKNYKGKVIYIDFWATWCAPCRAGIEKIKPLKEELKNEDIVFVYITNPTSPEKTYQEMKPEIKGEHYKLNSDEWTHLTAKFNIYGIPHYALVDKNGRIINAHLPHLENDELKKVLMEQVKK